MNIPFLGITDPVSSLTHLLAGIACIIFGHFLVKKAVGNISRRTSLIVYVSCSIFLFAMSGVYHALEHNTTSRYVFQILDHAAIYLMIASSFTPIHIILFREYNRWLPLLIVWPLAIVGLVMTAIFFKDMHEGLILTFFLGMGWISVYTITIIQKYYKFKYARLVVIGGIMYTIGALFDYLNWPVLIAGVFGPHEVFHIFVILGAYYHWRLMFKIAKKPTVSKIKVLVTEKEDGFWASIENESVRFFAKNRQEIKAQVRVWVEKRFHTRIQPKKVSFHFIEENLLEF